VTSEQSANIIRDRTDECNRGWALKKVLGKRACLVSSGGECASEIPNLNWHQTHGMYIDCGDAAGITFSRVAAGI